MDYCISLDTLDDVKRRFERWRAGKVNKKGRIPDRLWDAALGILDTYSAKEVASALDLDIKQIKNKRKQRDQAISAAKPVRDVHEITSRTYAS